MVNNDAKYWKLENFSKWAIQFLKICSRNCCSNFADNSSISFFFNNHQSLEERNYIPYYMYTIVWGKKNAFTFLPHFWCFFEMAKLNGYNSAVIKSVTNKSVVYFFSIILSKLSTLVFYLIIRKKIFYLSTSEKPRRKMYFAGYFFSN